jgi:hypothetical protein
MISFEMGREGTEEKPIHRKNSFIRLNINEPVRFIAVGSPQQAVRSKQ